VAAAAAGVLICGLIPCYPWMMRRVPYITAFAAKVSEKLIAKVGRCRTLL